MRGSNTRQSRSREAPVLAVEELVKQFSGRGRERIGEGVLSRESKVKALQGVSFEIRRGETLGIIGESGSGKTTLIRCILGLEVPTTGKILLHGREVSASDRDARARIQSVFQDPLASLNPRQTVQQIIEEPLIVHRVGSRRSRALRIREVLASVRMPVEVLERRPGALSGGQRQRVAIARALATAPELLVADEPTSALDSSLQAQLLQRLRGLQEQGGFAMLLVTHDLGVAYHGCGSIGIMKKGRIVEIGETQEVFRSPKSEYAKRLLGTSPR